MVRTNPLSLLLCLYLVASCLTHISPPTAASGVAANERAIPTIIFLREALLAAVFLCTIFAVASGSRDRTIGISLFLSLCFVTYGVLVSALTGLQSVSVGLAFGLRSIMLISLTILLPVASTRQDTLMEPIMRVLVSLLLFELAICMLQLQFIAPFYGETFLGPRVFGSFASPLHLSLFSGACAICIAARKPARTVPMIGVCLFLCLASGGRAGLLLAFCAVIAILSSQLRLSLAGKYFGTIFAMTLIPAVFSAVSNPLISGRTGTAAGLLGDGRWEVWEEVLAGWLNADLMGIIFGLGIGTGSNAVAAAITDYIVTDSTFVFLLLSYGLFGLILFLIAFTYSSLKSSNLSYAALGGWFLAATSQIIFEIQPLNVILLISTAATLKSERFLGFRFFGKRLVWRKRQ